MNPGQPAEPASPEPAESVAADSARRRAGTEQGAPDKAARQQRSLDEVFGDVLPDSTRDERGDRPDRRGDADYLRDIPPHHG